MPRVAVRSSHLQSVQVLIPQFSAPVSYMLPGLITSWHPPLNAANISNYDRRMKNERAEFYETYRSLFRLLISTISFLVTANAALISVAANNKSALLILSCAMFPALILIVIFLFSNLYCSLFFSEIFYRKNNKQDREIFFPTSLSISRPDLYLRLKGISEINDFEKQTSELQKIKYQFTPPFARAILLLGIFLHIAVASTFWAVFGWPIV